MAFLPCFIAAVGFACGGAAQPNLFGPSQTTSGGEDASSEVDSESAAIDASTTPPGPDAQIIDAFVADQFIADAFVADTFVADTYVAPVTRMISCGSSQCVVGQEVCCDDLNDSNSSMCSPSATQCRSSSDEGVPIACAQTSDCRIDGGMDICCLSISETEQTESSKCAATCTSTSDTMRYQVCAPMDMCLPTTMNGMPTCQPSNAILPGYSLCQ